DRPRAGENDGLRGRRFQVVEAGDDGVAQFAVQRVGFAVPKRHDRHATVVSDVDHGRDSRLRSCQGEDETATDVVTAGDRTAAIRAAWTAAMVRTRIAVA